MDTYYDLSLSSKNLFRCKANVLLYRTQNLEKDQEKNSYLYQSSIKKAHLAEQYVYCIFLYRCFTRIIHHGFLKEFSLIMFYIRGFIVL